MKKQERKLDDLKGFEVLSEEEMKNIRGGVYPDVYYEDNKFDWNDQGRFFLMPDGKVDCCTCQSRIDMWGDFEPGETVPVRLSDLGAFSLLSARMMSGFGKQTGFTTECDCIVYAPFHNGLVRDFKSNLNGLHIRVADKDNIRKTIERVRIDCNHTLSGKDLRILAACMWDNMDMMQYQRICKGMNRQAGLGDAGLKDRIRKAYMNMCSSKNTKSKGQKI